MRAKGKLVFSIAKYKRWELKNLGDFRATWIEDCEGLTQDEVSELGYGFDGDTWFVVEPSTVEKVINFILRRGK